ncbi:MFS general substrate transporter [Teratosphaeria nubilosa]|uniref:MFS general substrate transporter n=1 Tax=Teratosphaeria nubilosa TaxID=161662 RepID=A0A6G1LB81_9PEZI|nr:MFS general substrate transporter [Teratosphaeria nubilosa]
MPVDVITSTSSNSKAPHHPLSTTDPTTAHHTASPSMPQVHSAPQPAEERGAIPECPPQDRGRAAWTSLAAVSATLMTTWGFVSAFGVFRSYYFTYAPFAGSQIVTEIGVMSLGFLQILAPPLLRYLSGRMQQRKKMMIAGMVLVVGGSLGAAFSQTPIQVLMSQGLIYGIGSGLLFAPSISYIDEWFLERRGLANGLFFGSNNIAAAAFSPIFSTLLRKVGPRAVLIGWAVFAAVTISCAILCLKERGRHEPVVGERRRSHRLFRRPLFWLLGTSVFLQGLANFLPAAYLPSYAADLGVSAGKGAILLTILNIAGMIGQALFGLLM